MQITALAVFLKDNKILLEKRKKKEDNYAGLWATPGGHKKPSESILKTLKREIKEELEIDVLEAEPLGIIEDIDPTSKKEFHHHMFLCRRYSDNPKKTNEQKKIEWFSINDLPENTADYLKKVKKLIR
ncbi:NUDIX domain-containing protein [Candidatus Woesearchaeota archaeon]|nr:NUDIX domain-containing protein [Candidatus Woesearchaeota archaeon]